MNSSEARRSLIVKIIQLSVYVEGDTFVISDFMKGKSRQFRYWMNELLETMTGNQISYKIIKNKCHVTLNVTLDAPFDITLDDIPYTLIEKYRPDELPNDNHGRRIDDLYNSSSMNPLPPKQSWESVPITKVTCASPRISATYEGHISLVDVAFRLKNIAGHVPNGPSALKIQHTTTMRKIKADTHTA